MMIVAACEVVFLKPFVYPFFPASKMWLDLMVRGCQVIYDSAMLALWMRRSKAHFLTLWHYTSKHKGCTSLSRETQIILLSFLKHTGFNLRAQAAVKFRESRLNSWHFTRQEKRVNYLPCCISVFKYDALHSNFTTKRFRVLTVENKSWAITNSAWAT